MLSRVQLRSSDRVFAFIAFLMANPHLKPLIHTIIVMPSAFKPSLLCVLPNISSILCINEAQLEEQDHEDQTFNTTISPLRTVITPHDSSLDIHHISLACFRGLGVHIQTLCLSSFSFPTSLSFAKILLAFTNIRHLECDDVKIKAIGNGEPLDMIRWRLTKQMQLKALSIDIVSMAQDGVSDGAACPGKLLFDSNLAPSTVETLLLIDLPTSKPDLYVFQPNKWCQLQCLVLQFSKLDIGIEPGPVVKLLESFPRSPRLKKVIIKWTLQSATTVVKKWTTHAMTDKQYERLEQVLVRLSRPRVEITCIIQKPTCANSLSFWARELEICFPYSKVTMQCHEVTAAGHDGRVVDLVISPNSKWVATGSTDSTIIIWSTYNGRIAQRWVAHNYNPVWSLAFSPDSVYLISGGPGIAAIWDLRRGVHRTAILGGHDNDTRACAWSPSGNTIATGSNNGTTQIWDAYTFQLRATVEVGGAVSYLAFSSNGLWLAYGCRRGQCCILNVTSGKLRRSLCNSQSDDRFGDRGAPRANTIAAFDPASGSTSIATTPCGTYTGVTIVDAETGVILAQLSGGAPRETMRMHDVSFSPDGKLVLGVELRAVYVWEASTGIELFRFGERAHVMSARFSPCGRYIASVTGTDGTVSLWTSSDGSCIATFRTRPLAGKVAFSPDGKTLSCCAKNGTVTIRQVHDFIPTDKLSSDKDGGTTAKETSKQAPSVSSQHVFEA